MAARTHTHTHTSSPPCTSRRLSEALLWQHSQVNEQHGSDHHDEAAEGRVEVNDTEQDTGAGHRVKPVQPVAVQLVLVQHGAALGVHLDGVGRLVLGQRLRVGLRRLVGGGFWLVGGWGGRGNAARLRGGDGCLADHSGEGEASGRFVYKSDVQKREMRSSEAPGTYYCM